MIYPHSPKTLKRPTPKPKHLVPTLNHKALKRWNTESIRPTVQNAHPSVRSGSGITFRQSLHQRPEDGRWVAASGF